jgi:hypothetical protein
MLKMIKMLKNEEFGLCRYCTGGMMIDDCDDDDEDA